MDRFERLFKEIEREITDLRTISRRGLGSIQFYSASQSVTKAASTSITIKTTIKIASGEPLPAFLTIATPIGYAEVPTYSGTYTYIVNLIRATSSAETLNGSVIVTSSARIASMTAEVS